MTTYVGGLLLVFSYMIYGSACSSMHELAWSPASRGLSQTSQPMYHILAGEMAYQQGDWDDAVKHYDWLVKHTDYTPNMQRAFEVLLQAGYHQRALAVGKQLLQQPQLAMTNFSLNMAALYLQTGSVDQAVELVQGLLDSGRPPRDLFVYLYQAYTATSKLTEPYTYLERFARHFSKQAEAQTFVASMAFLLADLPQGLHAIDRILELRPNDSSAYLLKANLLMAHNRPEESFSAWRKALMIKPQQDKQRVLYAQALIDHDDYQTAYNELLYLHFQYPEHGDYIKALAQVALKEKRYDTAAQWISLLAEYPKYLHQAYYMQGRLREQQERYDEALTFYLRVSVAADRVYYHQAQLAIIDIYQQQGNLDRALNYLATQRQQMTDTKLQIQSYLLQGEILRRAGLIEQAFDLYSEAITVFGYVESLFYERAVTASSLDQLSFLEQDIQRILAFNPENAAALNALGYELANRNIRLQEAKHYIVRAYRLRPNDPAILDSMGWIEFRLKNYRLAEHYVRRAMLDLYAAEIVGHLVEVMRARHKHQEADALLNQALQDFPDDEYINTLRQVR